ncbi:MAG: methyltransferase domain-containing protein [Caldithrix sp.]|nr:methyltransferase domain-containing protein [Caldithrix sp.]
MSTTNGYHNHVRHYQADAAFKDYFAVNRFEEQNRRRRYEALLNETELQDGERVLEIGCGGSPLPRLWTGRDFRYVAVDIPLNNLQKLKTSANRPMHLISGDIFKLPLQSASMDVVVLSEILEHLEEAVTALKQVHTVLKETGRLLLSVPYNETITYQLCVHCNKPTPTNAHFHSFDRETMDATLSMAGFHFAQYRYVNHKFADRLHFNLLAKGFSFGMWQQMHRLFNRMLFRPSHMIVAARK